MTGVQTCALPISNAKLAAEGQQPAQTVYQTELDKLRKQIYAVLNKTTTFGGKFGVGMVEAALSAPLRPILALRNIDVYKRQASAQCRTTGRRWS